MRVRKPDLFLNLDQHKLVPYHVHAMLIFRQCSTRLPFRPFPRASTFDSRVVNMQYNQMLGSSKHISIRNIRACMDIFWEYTQAYSNPETLDTKNVIDPNYIQALSIQYYS
jgi:hypothetical protein